MRCEKCFMIGTMGMVPRAALKYDGTADGTAGALLAIIRRLAMQLLYRDGTHTRYHSQSKGILRSRSRVTDLEPL